MGRMMEAIIFSVMGRLECNLFNWTGRREAGTNVVAKSGECH